MNKIISFIFLTLFISCSTNNKSFVKVDKQSLKNIWNDDSCGIDGERRGVAEILTKSWEKNRLNIETLKFILGQPAKVDTLNNKVIRFCYIVSSGIKNCESLSYDDVVHIGLVVFYDTKSSKITGCQTNLY